MYASDDPGGAILATDPGHPAPSDEELFLRYREQGDRAAMTELVQRYERDLYAYLLRLLRDPASAEDGVQTTFMHMYEKAETYDETRPLRPWILGIASHVAIDQKRRAARRPATSIDANYSRDHKSGDDPDRRSPLAESLSDEAEGPDQIVEEEEQAEWVHDAVDSLPPELRQPIKLIFFEGRKYREAAEVLRLPLGTVKSRVHEALVRLHIAHDQRAHDQRAHDQRETARISGSSQPGSASPGS